MSSKKDNFSLEELMTVLRGERPRWEIELVAEQVRQKLAEENRFRDSNRLMEEYAKLSEKCEKLQRSLVFWQGAAITILSTLLGIVIGGFIK